MQIDLDFTVINLAGDLGLDENSLVYVLSRLKNEGVSFLTCVLPQLSKAVLAGLEQGHIQLPTSFANTKWCFSRHFRVWLLKIFDKRGQVRENPCAESIYKIRQFCEYFYKIALPYSHKQAEESVKKFFTIESEVNDFKAEPTWVALLRKNFVRNYPEMTNYKVHDFLANFRPRGTSGAFYGSERLGTPYYVYKQLPDSITGTTFKAFRAFSGYFRGIKSKFWRVNLVETNKTTKVLFVPKDSRGPRIISKEPLHLVRLQMSYFDNMVSYLEKKTHRRINFLDQSVNQMLAYQGSCDTKSATLDLKDASDRVSYSFARRVFRDSPAIRWFLDNARSTHAKCSGTKVSLHKLAGMGSGLTFPTMALLIHLSICSSICDSLGLRYSDVARQVYVYGDDVVLPTSWFQLAINGLVQSGLQVNTEKSYSKSHFRESCGADFYKGVNVTPVRLRLSNSGLNSKSVRKTTRIMNNPFTGGIHKYKDYSLMLHSDGALLQMDRHCRELVKKGLLSLACYYYSKLEQVLGSDYGYCSGESAVLGRYSVDPIYINDDFHHRRWVPSAEYTEHEGVCPYKYLTDSLKRVGLDAEPGAPFGTFAKPRSITLRKKLVKTIALR